MDIIDELISKKSLIEGDGDDNICKCCVRELWSEIKEYPDLEDIKQKFEGDVHLNLCQCVRDYLHLSNFKYDKLFDKIKPKEVITHYTRMEN